MRSDASRASGSRILVNAGIAVVLVVIGTRSTGQSALVSYILAGLMALSAVGLWYIAYRKRQRPT